MNYVANLSKKIKKLNPFASLASEGLLSDVKKYYNTGSYLFNAQLGRSIFNGIPGNRITLFGGPQSSGKTYITLNILKNFLYLNPENIVLYFDTENAIETRQLTSMKIPNLDNFIHIPIKTLKDFKNQAVHILDEIRSDRIAGLKEDKDMGIIFPVLDSLGNAPSDKEVDDAKKDKDAADMGTRGKIVRSIFRCLTVELGLLQIPMIVTTHTYDSPQPFTPTGFSGGRGPLYSSSSIVEFTVKKEYDKERNKITGVILTSKLRKSRISLQDTKVPIKIGFGTGIDPYYGLLDFCLEHKIFKKDGRKILIGNQRFFPSEIEASPETFFSESVLKDIDDVAQQVFDYGFDDEVEVPECEKTQFDEDVSGVNIDDFDEDELLDNLTESEGEELELENND